MSTKSKFSIVLLFVVFCTWFYFTPHLAVMAMKSAAEEKDAAKLSGYVNFPVLKETLKASFNAKLAAGATQENNAKPFAALGAALASAFINPMIDSLVTPESLAMMMKGHKPQPGQNAERAKSSASDADVSMSYEGIDRFLVSVKMKGTTGEPLGLVFYREGFSTWKLSALRLPM